MPGATALARGQDDPEREDQSAAATKAPITTWTYRKASRENTVPRRTIVTSRQTQTSTTSAAAAPRTTIRKTGVRTDARAASGSPEPATSNQTSTA